MNALNIQAPLAHLQSSHNHSTVISLHDLMQSIHSLRSTRSSSSLVTLACLPYVARIPHAYPPVISGIGVVARLSLKPRLRSCHAKILTD